MRGARTLALLIGGIFLAYIAFGLLSAGISDHNKDGGSHLDLFIGGAVFGAIALGCFAKALGLLPAKRPNS